MAGVDAHAADGSPRRHRRSHGEFADDRLEAHEQRADPQREDVLAGYPTREGHDTGGGGNDPLARRGGEIKAAMPRCVGAAGREEGREHEDGGHRRNEHPRRLPPAPAPTPDAPTPVDPPGPRTPVDGAPPRAGYTSATCALAWEFA